MTEARGVDVAASLALRGATVVVALHPAEVMEADVVLVGDRIGYVGTAPAGVAARDCSGTLIVPGNVCAHHHAYSALSRGMPHHLAPPQTFTQILQQVWWRLDRALDERAIRASALRAGLDALRCGTTTIIDHHSSPNAIDGSLDIIGEALAELGVRSVLCYEVSDRDGPARAEAAIAENRRFLGRARGLARGMVGAHASFTLSDETLAALADAARSLQSGVHIHVAEDEVDQVDARRRSDHGVLERLDRAGILTRMALLAHCVQVNGPEMDLVRQAGATVVCNPRSNMNNAVGLSPYTYATSGVALGTDGIDGDLMAESQTGYFRAREAEVLTPASWPLARLAEGARFAGAIHGEPLLGVLRPGAPADVVVLDYPAPTPVCADNLAGHWVFGLSSGLVRDVFVGGELVIENGRSTCLDGIEVAREGAREAGRLWARMAEIPPHDFDPERSWT
ncbi:amidohydrolase family protein [Intrasporangium sp.]|uniref:amidohydrolase family protein n=1 Tax=Intrasporangium sp. TaxID=1925024 RepID=UPI00336575EC